MLPGQPADRARLLAGLLLLGQGGLVLSGILDHETPLLTAALLALLGGALVAWPLRRKAPQPLAANASPASRLRTALVALLGLALLGGVAAYNLLAGSALAWPEVVLLAYGAFLVAAAPRLHHPVARTNVGTLVAYSFPLVLAPLGLWALNALLDATGGGSPMRWYIRHLLVAPMAASMAVSGLDVAALGDTVRLATPRGPLFLTVGVVCAGLYAGVLFLGIFGLFAWESRTPPPRLVAYLALGLVGLLAANIARLVLLGFVGYRWGGAALDAVHEHAGWALFLAWMLAFWWLVLRRFEGPSKLAHGP